VIFPTERIGADERLYFRAAGAVFSFESRSVSFSRGGRCSFDTYFGVFAMTKWRKYTDASGVSLSVSLKGLFSVTLSRVLYSAEGTETETVSKTETDGDVKIPIPDEDGIYYFTLECLSESGAFYGAFYGCALNAETLKNVFVTAVICSFRREKFVESNMCELREKIIGNEKSQLRGHFAAIVVDNGCTLPDFDGVKVLKNRNTGGSGGFTRGLLEVMDMRKKIPVTHVILMDDDVVFDAESFERTFAFLKLLKEDYADAFIGGAMFRTDKKNVQNELADRWENGDVAPVKHMLDMADAENVFFDETEEKINYFSWWFCCMPVSAFGENNLPLPFFIKRDDIEFGLRENRPFITLDGINVWHSPFENKRPAFLEYYYIRNQCVMEILRTDVFNAKTLKKLLFRKMKTDIFTFRYKETEYRFRGVRDFLKGADFLEKTDPEKLNGELLSSDRKLLPLEDLPVEFDRATYEKNKKPTENALRRVLRRITFNGWIFHTDKTAVLPAAFPKSASCFAVRRALNYDENSNCGFITEKSFSSAAECLKNYIEICKLINKKFGTAAKSYRADYGKITGADFWRGYLGLKKQK
jgi:GT2 family glycosyltransferase